VKERGLTIKGAQQKLKDNREETINSFEIVTAASGCSAAIGGNTGCRIKCRIKRK
jgi:hypothetical protein